MIRLLLLAGFCLPTIASAADEWPIGLQQLPSAPLSMEQSSDGPLLTLDDGTAWTIRWRDDGPVLEQAEAQQRPSIPGMMPDGRVAVGTGQIRQAWFSNPTDEYGHAILGDSIEAKTLTVEDQQGGRFEYSAPDGTVFEDLYPRLWDMDGDGQDEVWAIRSGPSEGGRLEAFAIQNGQLRPRYVSDPIGLGYRWLNPVGIGSFTGEDEREVAMVLTPHIGGVLTILNANGDRLLPVAQVPGVSNHAIGSRELGLSWIGDLNGDRIDDFVLPLQSRRALVAVTFAAGHFAVLGTSEKTGHIETGFAELELSDGGRVILFADNGPALRWLRLPD